MNINTIITVVTTTATKTSVEAMDVEALLILVGFFCIAAGIGCLIGWFLDKIRKAGESDHYVVKEDLHVKGVFSTLKDATDFIGDKEWSITHYHNKK